MHASHGPQTHLRFEYDDKSFAVPNYGVMVRIADWDFMHQSNATASDRASNFKVIDRAKKPCVHRQQKGGESDAWGHCLTLLSKPAAELGPSGWPEADSVAPIPGMNVTCARLRGSDCRRLALARKMQPEEMALLEKMCPSACTQVPVTVTVPADAAWLGSASVKDDTTFRDSKGFRCRSWKGWDCRHPEADDFPPSETAALLKHCPVTCGRAVHGQKVPEASGGAAVLMLLRVVAGDEVLEAPANVSRRDEGTTEALVTWRVADAKRLLRLLRTPGVTVCARLGPWFIVDSMRLAERKADDPYLQAKMRGAGGKFRVSAKVPVKIVGNDGLVDGLFRGSDEASSSNKYGASVTKLSSFSDSRTIDPKAQNAAALRFSEEHQSRILYAGGVAYTPFDSGERMQYDFAHDGITPVDNRRFDLHFLFNQLTHKTTSKKYGHLFPDETRDWIASLFKTRLLNMSTGPATRHYRMTGGYDAVFCDGCELSPCPP